MINLLCEFVPQFIPQCYNITCQSIVNSLLIRNNYFPSHFTLFSPQNSFLSVHISNIYRKKYMKSQLTKSLADHIIAQNQKLKLQVIHLHKNLKLFQTKMMQALDQLISSLSSKNQSYQKILLFQNPYDCLTAFVQQITKSTSFSLDTSDQNQKLSTQNKRLNNKIKRLEEESFERIRKQQEIIEQLNTQIEQKKKKLFKLQEDYNILLNNKKTAEKQLNSTKEQMKILRLKLYEEQREKLTQIIVAGKKEMIEFRKSMEMESYKQQLEFKRQVADKDREIKSLTKNIQELINNNLTATSDLTVLQKIVKPIRESTQMKDDIIALRKEVFSMKNELRERQSRILGLEGQNADIILNRDNLRSRNERLQIEKNLLIGELQEKTEELETAIKDRKALDLYYSEKWHSEFSKVKQNLEDKYNVKLKALERDFELKKRQIEAQISVYLQRLRITRNELSGANTRIGELNEENELLSSRLQKLSFELKESHWILRECDQLHEEDCLARAFQWHLLEQSLKQQLRKWEYSSNKFESQLNKTISDFNAERTNLLHNNWNQIESLKKQHKYITSQLQNQHKQQLSDLENHYSNTKQAIEAGRLAEMHKFQQKLIQANLKHQQQLKQNDKLFENKLQKINQKFNQSQLKYQKLKKQREEQNKQYNIKLADWQKVLYQRDLQLVARDVQIEQFKKMKDTYLGEISSLNLRLNEESFQRRSLKVQVQSAQTKLLEKQQMIKMLENKKHWFKQEISRIQASYKQQFSELERIHKRALFQCKTKITELQRLFQKRPIKKQHYVHIQELQKKNLELKTEIHLKQAENLIIAEVKEYYEQKAQQNFVSRPIKTPNNFLNTHEDHSKSFIPTNTLLRNTNSNMRETVKTNQKSVFVKKYSNRKNKLIASSIKLDYIEDSQRDSEIKEVSQMKRYLSRQHRVHETSNSLKNQIIADRSKSCKN